MKLLRLIPALLFLVVSAFAQAAAGIGVGLASEGDGAVIRQVVPDGPAAKAELKEGDRIIEIGQAEGPMVSGRGMPMQDFAQLIRGVVGSTVRLKIIPAGMDETKAKIVTITRGTLNPLMAWGEPAGAKASAADPTLPAWAVPRLAPMRTQGAYLVILPPDYETSTQVYPIVVLVHGSGDNERSFGQVVRDLGREGVIYVAVRAPFADVGNTISNKQPSWNAWPSDQLPDGAPELMKARRDYVDWLFDAVADVRKAYRAKPGRVWLYGFSQGGGIVTSAAMIYPEKVQSVMSTSGSIPPDQLMTDEALRKVKEQGVRFLVLEGKEDDATYIAKDTVFAEKLKAASIPIDFRLLPGKHEITPEMFSVAREWLAKDVRQR